jgi:hypothetical protein
MNYVADKLNLVGQLKMLRACNVGQARNLLSVKSIFKKFKIGDQACMETEATSMQAALENDTCSRNVVIPKASDLILMYG